MNNYTFFLENTKLENVKMYKYLGLVFSTKGNFNIAKQELKKNALKALFKLKADLGTYFRSDIILTMKLFDALVKPILLYGCEIWGADNKIYTNDNDPLEQVHIKFCKMLLGTSKTSVNNACRGELGRYPIGLDSTYKSIKYWTEIITKESNMLSKLSYIDSLNNVQPGCWAGKRKEKISHYTGLALSG